MTNFQSYIRKGLGLLLLSAVGFSAYAQETALKITGKVVDEFQHPIANVIVKSQNGKNGGSTNWDGEYAISVGDGSQKVIIQKDGFVSQVIALSELTDGKTITLQKDAHDLDSEIDLGYATVSRRQFTGAAANVTGEILERSPVANLSQTFAGRLPGLTTQETFSELSRANTELLIRGINSARRADPMVIIDGIPTSYNSNQSLEYISPNEIETITILKDASAQAMYGIQGANGVIVVKTKRGRKGNVEIKSRLDHSIQQALTRPTYYNAGDYAELRNLASFNDGNGTFHEFSETQINHFRTGDLPELYPNNDWYERFMKDFAAMQRVGVNVTGGNDKITYFSNLNFMHQGGYFKTEPDKYDANPKNIWFNYRSNVDIQFNNYLSGYLRLSGNVKREKVPGGSSNEGAYSSIFQLPPTMFGPVTPDVLDPNTGEIIKKGGQVITTERIGAPTYGILNRSGYVNHTVTNISSQFGLNLDMGFLTKGLNLSGEFAYQTNSVGSMSTRQNYERVQRTNDWDKLEFNKKGLDENTPLAYSKGSSYYYHLTYKGQLKYNRTFGNHEIQATGYALYQNLTKANTNSPELLPYNRISTGIYANYGYDNRYFLTGTVGYSGSEQYAQNHRYVATPAVGVSWLASNESFMESTKPWLSLLKFRASWGKTANDQSELRRYAYLDNITAVQGGPIAYLQYMINENQIGNPLIQAEISTKSNLGIDVGLFNSLTFSADVFKERMENMVVGAVATIPAYQGVPLGNYPRLNAGTFENQGYELSLRYDRALNEKMSFHLGGMYSYNKNQIIHWNEAIRTEDFAFRKREEGYSYGQEFGYLVDYSNGNGFFNTQDELQNSGLEYGFGTPRLGDLKYQDLNNDGTIDERDQAPIGNGNIPRTTYSFYGGFKYAGFDMNFIFQGLGKYSSIIGGTGIWETSYDGIFGSLHANSWTQERYEKGEDITWPALSLAKSVNHEGSDFVNFNRSYLRLKNLEVGYTLPRDLTNKWTFDQVRIVFSGQNLLTWDKMKTKDFGPEGGTYLNFPMYRVYSFGINLVL